MTDRLQIAHELPEGIESLPAEALYKVLAGPTLFEMRGQRDPALFVSVLLHGDEVGGWEAVRRLIKRLRGSPPARSLNLFVGNVRAARASVRHLPDQPDFNRVWDGRIDHPLAETARLVTGHMRARGCFAGLDLHNNSGVNPCHVCIAKRDSHTLRLGSLFSPLTVLVDFPRSIQSAAFADFCPSVTLEAGRTGDLQGVSRILDTLESLLPLESLDDIAMPDEVSASLYATVARIELDKQASFAFEGRAHSGTSPDMVLSAHLESRNFETLPKGTLFARLSRTGEPPLVITSQHGRLNMRDWFEVREDALVLARDLVFSMYTTNRESVRQDCLCYVMQPLPLAAAP